MVPGSWQTMYIRGRRQTEGESWMTKFRHLIWMVIAAVALTLSASQRHAQRPDVGDPPGRLPDDSGGLDPECRKAAVYSPTPQAPGTIISSTRGRHPCSIHGDSRPRAHGPGA